MRQAQQFEIVKIKNISTHHFPALDVLAANADYNDGRTRVFVKPDVPVLMWDGETYEMAPGEEKAFPAFLANYFAIKIVDRVMIERGEIKQIRDERSREKYRRDVYMIRDEVEEATEPVSTLPTKKTRAEKTMAEIRAEARELGIEFALTAKKKELIKLIENAA